MDKQEKPTTESEKPTTAHHPGLLLWALGLAGVIAVSLFIWKVPQLQVKGAKSQDRIKLENDARGTLVQAIGGLGLFVTAYFGFQNLRVAQENLEETRKKQVKDADIAQKNFEATEEKQVTERFAKAIELLGNTSIHVRLGAIYALERISKDSDKDYWQVMEILTAYVRETSPYPLRKQSDKEYTPFWKENTNSQDNIAPITTDIQAVLTVITRRKKKFGQGEENIFDFRKSNLRLANLKEANLQRVNLKEANLQKADLRGTILEEAFLQESYLQGAYLWRANLQRAILRGANLQKAILQGAILQRAILRGANLQRANLEGAYLKGAKLEGADLIETKNLTIEQIKKADNWEKAKYDEKFRAELGLPPDPPTSEASPQSTDSTNPP